MTNLLERLLPALTFLGMASAVYGKGRNAFATAGINWTSDTIKAMLVNTTSYTVSINVDQFFTDVPGGAIIAAGVALTSASATLGTLNAATVTFSSVSGSQIGAIVLYKDTGTPSTSALIAYIDTATGLPLTPNGGTVTLTWDTGANKIFTLFKALSESERGLLGLLGRAVIWAWSKIRTVGPEGFEVILNPAVEV